MIKKATHRITNSRRAGEEFQVLPYNLKESFDGNSYLHNHSLPTCTVSHTRHVQSLKHASSFCNVPT